MYQILSQSVRFCRLYIKKHFAIGTAKAKPYQLFLSHRLENHADSDKKTFWCVFRFTVLTAVVLQNANAKFRVETLFREAENVYISVQHIYSDNMYQILSQSVRF